MKIEEICKFIDDYITEDAKQLEIVEDASTRLSMKIDHLLLLSLLKSKLIAKYTEENN